MDTKILLITIVAGIVGLSMSFIFYGWKLMVIILLLGFANKVDMVSTIRQEIYK